LELSAVEMKNWLPAELGWPVLAIATEYFLYADGLLGFSSLMVYPGPPLPALCSSPPPCTTAMPACPPGTIRWNQVES
jgi:hypothetical protein